MTNREWKNFVNYNIVPKHVFKIIASKIKYKLNLTKKELAIYIANSELVENLLKSKY